MVLMIDFSRGLIFKELQMEMTMIFQWQRKLMKNWSAFISTFQMSDKTP